MTRTDTPPASCGFTARTFGASYEDGVCCDGYLWDLDSADGDGYLTWGGEIPCPSCNTARYLDYALEKLSADIPYPSSAMPAQIWEGVLRRAHDLNPHGCSAFFETCAPFCLLDLPGRVASPEIPFDEDPALVWREWPWPVADLSAHTLRRLVPRGR